MRKKKQPKPSNRMTVLDHEFRCMKCQRVLHVRAGRLRRLYRLGCMVCPRCAKNLPRARDEK